MNPRSLFEACPRCDGIGSVCQACDRPIDECECFEDSEPCLCDRCNGRGKVLPGTEGDDDALV